MEHADCIRRTTIKLLLLLRTRLDRRWTGRGETAIRFPLRLSLSLSFFKHLLLANTLLVDRSSVLFACVLLLFRIYKFVLQTQKREIRRKTHETDKFLASGSYILFWENICFSAPSQCFIQIAKEELFHWRVKRDRQLKQADWKGVHSLLRCFHSTPTSESDHLLLVLWSGFVYFVYVVYKAIQTARVNPSLHESGYNRDYIDRVSAPPFECNYHFLWWFKNGLYRIIAHSLAHNNRFRNHWKRTMHIYMNKIRAIEHLCTDWNYPTFVLPPLERTCRVRGNIFLYQSPFFLDGSGFVQVDPVRS